MKKVIAIGMIFILLLGLLPSCSKELTEEEMEEDMSKEQNVSYEPFALLAMDGEYSLTVEAGFKTVCSPRPKAGKQRRIPTMPMEKR